MTGELIRISNSVNFDGRQKVATPLAVHREEGSSGGITLRWTISEVSPEITFHIARASGLIGSSEEIGRLDSGSGELVFSYSDNSCEGGKDLPQGKTA